MGKGLLSLVLLREKGLSSLPQQGASGAVPMFGDPISDGGFSGSPGGWAANVYLSY